jgi:SH3-like domain-containing protein
MRRLHRCPSWIVINLLFASGCVTSTPSSVGTLSQRVQASTVLPHSRIIETQSDVPADLVVAPYVVMTSRVARPRAEMRVGPGSQFELLDLFLSRDTEVVILSQHGVWRKILPIHDGPVAWVHNQALSRAKLNTHSIHLRSQRLPVVQVVHATDKVWLYGKNSLASAQVPRGSMFRTLRLTDHGALVWLAETNSVVWLSRKDVL